MINKFSKSKYLLKQNDLDRNILYNILGTFLIRGGALLVSVISMPIYIRFFQDSKVLGLWFTILSIMTWILSCDLGIGNGLRNSLVEAIVLKDQVKIKQLIISAYSISFFVATCVGIIGYWLIGIIEWNIFFNISTELLSLESLIFAIRTILIGIIFQFILKLVTSILYAMQKTAMTNLISLISSTTQILIVLCLPIQSSEMNLKVLSIIYVLCTNIPLLIATVLVFVKELKLGFPKLDDIKLQFALNILKLGGAFFFVQVLFMIINNTNEIIITRLYGSECVVDYQIYNKIFTIVGSLFMIALTPLWSAITMAYSEKNQKWLISTYRKLNIIVCISVIVEFGIAFCIKPIVFLWIGKNVIEIHNSIAFAFAVFGGIYIYQSALSTIACGLGKLRIQTICYALAVLLKIILVYIANLLGLPWIFLIIINIIILVPYCIIQPKILLRYLRDL